MSIKFIAGLLIGGAIVHFLNTEEGRNLVCRFKKDADKMREEFEDLAEDLVDRGKSMLNVVEEEIDKATS